MCLCVLLSFCSVVLSVVACVVCSRVFAVLRVFAGRLCWCVFVVCMFAVIVLAVCFCVFIVILSMCGVIYAHVLCVLVGVFLCLFWLLCWRGLFVCSCYVVVVVVCVVLLCKCVFAGSVYLRLVCW